MSIQLKVYEINKGEFGVPLKMTLRATLLFCPLNFDSKSGALSSGRSNSYVRVAYWFPMLDRYT